VGSGLNNVLTSAPVQQLETGGSSSINPISNVVSGTTQTIGTATGLGAPVNNLQTTVGNGLNAAGAKVSGSTNNQVVQAVGCVVSQLGNSVTRVGGLLTGGTTKPLAPITGALSGG
ncbi:collagen-like triple helix repeat-containing protein, partial [Burkholderia pseudomallei]